MFGGMGEGVAAYEAGEGGGRGGHKTSQVGSISAPGASDSSVGVDDVDGMTHTHTHTHTQRRRRRRQQQQPQPLPARSKQFDAHALAGWATMR